MKALVVDDSASMRQVLSRLVAEVGLQVAEASDGEQALIVLQTDGADIILLDWNMPNLNGIDFLKLLRGNPAWSNTKVVMITSETTMASVDTAKALGVVGYIMKPFSPQAVRTLLTTILGL